MGALCYNGPTASPLRISRTVFDCAERCHTRLDSSLWNPVCRAYMLRKDKTQSTAFLVAQIFLLFC
jgi:hypothetical protein